MKIYSVYDPRFKPYGQIVEGMDETVREILAQLHNTPLPDGVMYTAEDPALQELPAMMEVSEHLYGGMPVQLGWCNGHNTKLNCLEYHRTVSSTWVRRILSFCLPGRMRSPTVCWIRPRSRLFGCLPEPWWSALPLRCIMRLVIRIRKRVSVCWWRCPRAQIRKSPSSNLRTGKTGCCKQGTSGCWPTPIPRKLPTAPILD